MKSAKEEILDQVRRAIAGSAKQNVPDSAIERRYRQQGGLTSENKLLLFEDRLRDYGCEVVTCGNKEISAAIAQILSRRNKRALTRPSGIPPTWLPAGFSFPVDEGISYHDLDQSEGVLTGCALAIAETGTIVLRHSSTEGRRALSLIPDYHLCIVLASQVVESVVEGFREMNQFSRMPITTISGPSATSDIEMIRVQGVHGPRTLDVILVQDTPEAA
ncbi:MAG TPA: LUD domain-containing protein [Bryobacteraceae bacterium]|jgi:L-lactate dehydrogenase complex protein LldG|nr:LUD domain-containing protein [Bryobacteraceae bacterium]